MSGGRPVALMLLAVVLGAAEIDAHLTITPATVTCGGRIDIRLCIEAPAGARIAVTPDQPHADGLQILSQATSVTPLGPGRARTVHTCTASAGLPGSIALGGCTIVAGGQSLPVPPQTIRVTAPNHEVWRPTVPPVVPGRWWWWLLLLALPLLAFVRRGRPRPIPPAPTTATDLARLATAGLTEAHWVRLGELIAAIPDANRRATLAARAQALRFAPPPAAGRVPGFAALCHEVAA